MTWARYLAALSAKDKRSISPVRWSGLATRHHGGQVAFLYSDGTMKDLNTLIPPNSAWVLSGAFAINDSGQITGFGTINGAQHAFLLSPASVPFASFKPQAAIDLDANAFIVGGKFTLGMGSDGIAPLTGAGAIEAWDVLDHHTGWLVQEVWKAGVGGSTPSLATTFQRI